MASNQMELKAGAIQSRLAPWILTLRPKTLVASLVPVMAGTLLAKGTTGSFDPWIAFWMLMSAICIQTGTNLINDAFDFKKGTDNASRLGPVRGIQLGLFTSQQVFKAGLASFILAFVFGIPLIAKGGSLVLLVMCLSALSGYLYTGGPIPLAYAGLGDVFVIVFFGWVCTCASYFLQTGTLDWGAWVVGTQVGLHSTVMIAINNLRDVAGDTQSGKKTLAVRFGQFFARCEITALVFLPFLLGLFWLVMGSKNAAIIPFICFPQALRLVNSIWQTAPSATYNGFLAQGAFIHLLFGGLLSVGFII